MTYTDTLRSDAAPTDESLRAERSKARPRAERALPTDRMKFPVQVQTLQAFAAASSFGKRAVNSDELTGYVPVTPGTAGLNNAFFKESGLLERESRGRYVPTPVVNQFAREASFDQAAAGKLLGPVLRTTWYYAATRSRLEMGSTTKQQLIQCLAHAAGASADHAASLEGLLDWMEFAGLLQVDGEHAVLVGTEEEPPAPVQLVPDPEPTPSPAAAASKGRPVLSIGVEFSAEDFQDLAPAQISALFAAIGELVAVKNAAA